MSRQIFLWIDGIVRFGSLVAGRLRARIVAMRGAQIGLKAFLGPRCKVTLPWCVAAGTRFVAEQDVFLKLVSPDAKLKFGDFVFLGKGTEFDVQARVEVGDHTVIAPRCFITDHNHGVDPGLRVDEQMCVSSPVLIGSDVWLGTGVVILPGVTIGNGAVVGANSVVTRDIPENAIAVGSPAKVIRSRDEDGDTRSLLHREARID